jgi:hypothetical protein
LLAPLPPGVSDVGAKRRLIGEAAERGKTRDKIRGGGSASGLERHPKPTKRKAHQAGRRLLTWFVNCGNIPLRQSHIPTDGTHISGEKV